MGTIGDCFDNSVAESFFATLQTELLDRSTWPTREELASAVFAFIEGFYNPRRRHSTLGYLSPADYEHAARLDASPRPPHDRLSPHPHRPGRRGHSIFPPGSDVVRHGPSPWLWLPALVVLAAPALVLHRLEARARYLAWGWLAGVAMTVVLLGWALGKWFVENRL